MSKDERKQELVALYHELQDCQKCGLCEARTNVVFGSGDPDTDLMLVGEAPGFNEDQQGKPFVGQAGKLLDKLLAEIGLVRDEVFIANVLKCRPPDNRDPRPEEIEACQGHLFAQIELIKPRVICTLGNFATKLLTGKPDGITKVHGTPRAHAFNGQAVFLFPIFHPAAALYTPAMLETLRADFEKLPKLLKEQPPEVGADGYPDPSSDHATGPASIDDAAVVGAGQSEADNGSDSEQAPQLGLF